MLERLLDKVERYRKKKKKVANHQRALQAKEKYFADGQIPWSEGYNSHKIKCIKEGISNVELLSNIRKKILPSGFGYRLDERVVEYSWIFSNLPFENLKMLDAGSTFNFPHLVSHPSIENKDLTIFTYSPEDYIFNQKRISYVYGDLRDLCLKKNYFDLVVSQSTIEHIDMDNSIYGYDLEHNENITQKSYDYLLAVNEMIRVLNSGGTLLLTFPFGKFENHGFFQQFDTEMVERILDLFQNIGTHQLSFFKYEAEGWRFSNREDVEDSESYNPHTGRGKKDDLAAHSRAVACIKFNKN